MDKLSKKYRPSRADSRVQRSKQLSQARNAKRARQEEASEEEREKNESTTPRSSDPTGEGKSGEKFRRFDFSDTSTTSDEYFLLHSSALNAVVTGKCPNCTFDALKADVSRQQGFAFTITVSCSQCNEAICQIQSSPRVTSSESSRPPFDVNRKLVEGFVNIGAGYTAMVKFGAALSIKVMDQSTYRDHLKKLVDECVKLKEAILAKSRAAVREFYEMENPELKGQEVIDVHVSYDGSWHKRGFTSNYGFVSVIEINTGLAIDFETFSKYCHICAINAAELGEESDEYKAWYAAHTEMDECNSNFTGSPGNVYYLIFKFLCILWIKII